MKSRAINQPVFRIGRWRFLSDRNLLKSDREQRELEHRVSVLLLYLCRNPARTLSKDELLSAVWGQRVVGEDSLAVAVSQLRRALDDPARSPSFIQTVPGVGYRWIGSVFEENTTVSGTWRRWSTVVGGLLVAVLVALWFVPDRFVEPEPEDQSPAALLKQASDLLASEEPKNWRRAVGLFRQTIATDPGQVEAWVGLVESKLRQIDHDHTSVIAHYEELQGLLSQALRLDPSHDRALLLQANLAFLHGRDYPLADQTFRTLLAAHDEHAGGRLAYANFLLARGRFAEAMAQLQTLRHQHPLLYAVPAVAWNYLMQGETELAWQEIQRITDTEPTSAAYHASAQHIAWQRGDEALAMRHLRALMVMAGFDAQRLDQFDRDFADGGLAAVHARLLAERETAGLGHYRPPLSWARYALVAGQTALALDHLVAALEQRQVELLWIAVDPHYRPLHDHARFQQAVREIVSPTVSGERTTR